MELIIKISQFVLSLSMLVFIHELGHFVFARLFKVRVEKFYLFFDIKFSLFKFKPKNSDTEYGVGWLPLGGYCKMAGMIDESMDTEHIASEPQPYEFRSKPAWQRLLVMLGGVLFNVIFAFLIYAGMLLKWGDGYFEAKETPIAADAVARSLGFKDGDKVVKLNGEPVERFNRIKPQITLYRQTNVTVERNGELVDINFDYYENVSWLMKGPLAFVQEAPFVISEIPDTSANKNSGLLKGDIAIALNNHSTPNTVVFTELLAENKSSTAQMSVLRGNDTLTFPININESGMIGMSYNPTNPANKFIPLDYKLKNVIPAAAHKLSQRLIDQLCELRLIFTPKTKAYTGVGSFIMIATVFNPQWDWISFWNITALLSVMLAVVNLLPIPALDGGHALFTIYEIITGRKPSEKFLIYAQTVGLVIVLIIMVLTMGNDLIRFVF